MDSMIGPELSAAIARHGAGRLTWNAARVDGDPEYVTRADFWPTLDVRLVVERGPGIVSCSPLMDRWYIEHPEPANPSGRGVYPAGGWNEIACFMMQKTNTPWMREAAAAIARLLCDGDGRFGRFGYIGGAWPVRLAVAYGPKAAAPEGAPDA